VTALGALRRLDARTGARRFGWGFADQGLSSATSLVLTLLAARAVGPHGLGVVTIGWTGYLVVVGLHRAALTRPLVAVSTAVPESERMETRRRGLTVTIVAALVATAAFLAGGLVLPSELGEALLLFAPWIGVTLLQDYWRAVLFRDGREAAAAANDAVWLVVTVAAAVPAAAAGGSGAVVAAWGAGALAGAIVGLAQVRGAPLSLRLSLSWWRRAIWPFSRWLTLEGVIYSGGSALAIVILTSSAGPAAVGGLRAANSVFAPLTFVTPAVVLPGLPAMARAVERSSRDAIALSARLSSLVLAIAAAYVLFMGTAGSRLIPLVFGASFDRYRELAFPIGVSQAFVAVGIGFTMFLTARTKGPQLFAARVIESTAVVAFVALLTPSFGVLGAAWAYAAGAAIGALTLVWLAFRDHRGAWSREQAVGVRSP
jgi:O-antigen/teichoic acid export membrane protein